MSIECRILGGPGRDNALLMRVDGGQSLEHLLFDCGAGCLDSLTAAEVRAVDQLFFSHLHMDHVCGFDAFFRSNLDRQSKPNSIWGPPETARILQHRFQGFLWNIPDGAPSDWRVTEVFPGETRSFHFELQEAFSIAHPDGPKPRAGVLHDGEALTVEALAMDHGTPSLAYIVREKSRLHIDPARLAAMGLQPGPWLKRLKDFAELPEDIVPDGCPLSAGELRKLLISESPGGSAAYLTDFLLDDKAEGLLAPALRGCGTLVCESQYLQEDLELARRHRHMTSVQAAGLAARVGAGELFLFHLSARYEPSGWLRMLEEARAIFPNTRFPSHWSLLPA